ncbi:MAG: MerR family transcriptional regulator [Candidatus Eisenbacteria bacterium]|uniref:MerR family transcriptional regulator n=1 Tax=Eiseniibacteriota bacterium TaxID=2212470 RepID=A0A956M220_UNCEI|nr:MerR family transcriptional regulator [Candidatus Eisenbacteria bacterium]
MKTVANRTGLKPALVRAWERRYGAVVPFRTETNRRVYSESDIQRLQLLHRVTEVGHPIRLVARLSEEELTALLDPTTRRAEDLTHDVMQAMHAISDFDEKRLRHSLDEAAVALGRVAYLEQFLSPMLHAIGNSWARGTMRPAHEHFAAVAVTQQLIRLQGIHKPVHGPVMVIGTLSGQQHELGALMAAVIASDAGWDVSYCGPNLPAEEIAAFARARHASAVAISLVYPDGDLRIADSLRVLRRCLDESTALILGGRAAPSYLEMLAGTDCHHIANLPRFLTFLQTIQHSVSC